MPDWTYQTVFRPILFRLGPERGRRIALGSMGQLARLPLGRHVIQFMGHMQPDSRLASERNKLRFPTQVGLGCALDPQMQATPALAEFGFGFLEIGPVVSAAPQTIGNIHLDLDDESVRFEPPYAALTPSVVRARLKRDGPFGVPVLARIEPSSSEEASEILAELGTYVDGFVVPLDHLEFVRATIEGASERKAVILVIDPDAWQNESQQDRCVQSIREGWAAGIIVGEPATEDAARRIGQTHWGAAVQTVRMVREELGPDPLVVGSVGIHCPADALDYIEAGADLVQVDSGLVFAGPGLPKRINEALLYRQLKTRTCSATTTRISNESWFWAMLMGLGMFVGGLMAMIVATTRVVLPYDESMAGLTREQLVEINDRLLLFMTHDRVTLSGTMLAVGILYMTMAWWGIRRGVHWAQLSIVFSALAGFFSFFSFLGFGYFDPFHAFVTAILFQFLLLTIHARLPERFGMEAPELRNDRRWKSNQWGQLLFVIHGAVLIVAGLVISGVGMTSVFVPEDLEFMQTSAAELYAHPQLVPLVAHDRATFGGMLIACGVATLLPAMWGFRRGQFWLWWSLMLAGNIAYVSTILVHWIVGYDSLHHLLPAYGGLAWLWAGGIASYSYLAATDQELETEWAKRLMPLEQPN